MNEIDLRRLDLNLLVTFEVLMSEGSVTRAAARLGRTQSAVSHSLTRLREQKTREIYASNPDFGSPDAPPTDLSDETRAQLQQAIRQMRAQKTGPAGDKNFHITKFGSIRCFRVFCVFCVFRGFALLTTELT